MNKFRTLLLALPLTLISLNSPSQDKEVFLKGGLSSSHQTRKELVSYYPSLGLDLGLEHKLTKNLSIDYSMSKEFAYSFDRESRIALSETGLGINLKSEKVDNHDVYLGLGAKVKNIYQKENLNEFNANYFGGYLKTGTSWRVNDTILSYFEIEYSLTHSNKYPFPGINPQIKFTIGLGLK